MKSILFLVFFTFLIIIGVFAQNHKIQIPELKNITSENWYPFPKDSLSIPDKASFDLMIIYWESIDYISLLRHIYVLAHKGDGWYSIIEKREHKFGKRKKDVRVDTTVVIDKLNNHRGDSLFNVLTENHLFEIKDAVFNRYPCITRLDTIYKKGKQIIKESGGIKTHGPTYKIEIRTQSQAKGVYFFDPFWMKEECTPQQEIVWFINSIQVMEKYLGR